MTLDYAKTKPFLVCIDSDGCAMDTMTSKHKNIFGPLIVEEWGLEHVEEVFLELWSNLNLYTRTRGINRFKGLSVAFKQMKVLGYEMPNMEAYHHWVETTNTYSNDSLKQAIIESDDASLKKVLHWSEKVNQQVMAIKDSFKAFKGVREVLDELGLKADIAIVSSANKQAIQDEWEDNDLLTHVNIAMGQEYGSKESCIEQLLSFGYDTTHVLFIGDALGDLNAAIANQVHFFPIIAGQEEISWQQLHEIGQFEFFNQTYSGTFQQKKINTFLSCLK